MALALVGVSAHPADARPLKRPRPTTTTTGPRSTTTTVPTMSCRNGYVGVTYDDGPTASTPTLLAALAKAHVRATFFDIGAQAELYPGYVRSEVAAGHDVGNHTYDHPDLTTVTPDVLTSEIARTQAILTPLTGATPKFLRPPYGAMNEAVWDEADAQDVLPVIWTTDTNDWAGPRVADIVSAALAVPPGGVILMHDGYPNTIAAVPLIAAGLANRGLCPGRIVPSTVAFNVWDGLDYYATAASW